MSRAERADPHGWLGFWSLVNDGTWEPDTKRWLELLEPGDLFVDIGAWIGPVSVWALQRGAYILAVEPDPVAFEELIRRVPEESCVLGAITPRQGIRTLLVNPVEGGAFGDSMSRLSLRRDESHPTRWVEDDPHVRLCHGYTLSGLCKYRQRPALVKVDVEGYETRLLPSLAPWCRDAGVLSMQVSCHGEMLPASVFGDWPTVEWPDDPHGTIRCYAW